MNSSFGLALGALRRALGDVKLVALLLAANLAPSLAFALAPSAGAFGAFGHSLVGRDEPFLGGYVAAELARVAVKGWGGASWLALFALLLLASVPLQIALSGGVAARALEGQAPFSAADFVADCVRLFGRNLRLFGWALLGLIPVAVVAAGAAALVDQVDDPLGERSLVAYKALRFALIAAAFATWRLAFDAAKVRAVSAEPRAMRRAAWQGLGAAFRGRLWLGYAGLGLAGALGVLLLMRLHAALPVGSTGGALVALAFAQIVLGVRLVFSVAATNYVAASNSGEAKKLQRRRKLRRVVPSRPPGRLIKQRGPETCRF
jgi:hypothetical protein